MFGKQQVTKLKTLGAAEAALAKYEKTAETIASAVRDLTPLIVTRQAAERNLRDAEILAADDGGGNLEKPRKALESSLSALDEAAARLRGFRGRLSAGAAELARQHEMLAKELPEYHTTIREQFMREWTEACEVFGKVLSKRAALEILTGERFDLPQPGEKPHDLGESSRPLAVLTGLQNAIESLAAMGLSRPAVAAPGTVLNIFDPRAVYVLRKPVGGLEAGALVVPASLQEGLLAWLVAMSTTAVLAPDPEAQAGHEAAWNAVRKIKAEADAVELRKHQAIEAELKRKIRAEDEKRDPSLRWVEGSERKDPNERTRSQFNEDQAKRRGPAAQVASDRASIEAMVDGSGGR